MKVASRRGRRDRAALSSVYGFIMIYLLAIASLQAISMSLSSSQNAESAAQRAGQVAQMRSLEHLRVGISRAGDVTIANDGLIPSSLSLLLMRNSSLSRELLLRQSLPVGASVVLSTKPAPSFPSSVAVVTSLGNVFSSSHSSAPPSGGTWKTLLDGIAGPGVDAQLYQNTGDPTRFFLSTGSSAFAFSSSKGTELWSFNESQGTVTDVLPLSDGGVYVSDGYFGDHFSSSLSRLTSSGAPSWTYTMRLLRLYSALEIQFPDNDQPPSPIGSQPVQKGAGGLYAYYDGWFFSSAGPSQTTVPADSFNLASSDESQFYLFTSGADPGGWGCTQPRGNTITVYAYSANASGVQKEWTTPVFLNVCDYYPSEVIASSAGSGLVASLFSETYWSQGNYFGGPYQGGNPFLAVLSSSTGEILRSGNLDSSGYTSLATDGTRVYLSIPSSGEVEVVSASGGGGGTFHNLGFPASKLIWAYNSLFAISDRQVRVYDSSMSLKKSLDFSPQSFYSLSNSKPFEPQMMQPSFLVLNSTSYVALLRNSSGYGSLVVGAFAP
jgi:hypothetical protein